MATPASLGGLSLQGIPIYNGSNFDVWMPAIERKLLAHDDDLLDVVEGTSARPPPPPAGADAAAITAANDAIKAWRKRDAKAFSIIECSMTADKQLILRGVTSAKDAWAAVQREAGTQSTLAIAGQVEQLFSLSISDYESAASFCSDVKARLAKLEGVDLGGAHITFPELVKAVILLLRAPAEYATLKAILMDKPPADLTFSLVSQRLQEFESTLKSSMGPSAFQVKGGGGPARNKVPQRRAKKPLPTTFTRGGPCQRCGYDHKTHKCYLKRTEDWEREHPGTPVPDWRLLDRKEASKGKGKGGQAQFVEGPDSDEDDASEQANAVSFGASPKAFFSQYTVSKHKHSRTTKACADSGCTRTMSNDISLFTDYQPLPKPERLLGAFSKSQCVAIGRGTLTLPSAQGGPPLVLKNCLHVPGLREFLLSISQLDKEGYYVVFGGGRCIVTIQPASDPSDLPPVVGTGTSSPSSTTTVA
jgi:hypothetical protein